MKTNVPVKPREGRIVPDIWCVPALARYRSQFLILDRCTAFEFDQLDCLEYVTQWCSLSVADHFDDLSAARGMFEFIHEREPALESLNSKPLPYDFVRTVAIRNVCEGE